MYSRSKLRSINFVSVRFGHRYDCKVYGFDVHMAGHILEQFDHFQSLIDCTFQWRVDICLDMLLRVHAFKLFSKRCKHCAA